MSQTPKEEKIREHTFDGIEEFDKSLPNWWLFTLYATIAFSIAYWVYYQKASMGLDQEQELEAALAEIDEVVAKAKAEAGVIDNDTFAVMAKDPDIVSAGQLIYTQNCSACHGQNLEGGIGLPLNDADWKHGGQPLDIQKIVVEGVATAGMPPWGPVLGEEKVNQVVAFLVSKQAK
ncbi:cbb3-type cytochrome c oxidase N-terminal domain-containing protein [Pelagicoccus sp. SDUM812005]|uniref:cbb3-type cytochrome c oxidase N-terminal domain-containing protein n=1 Tax=Pelagicoccus sp. SDUM812005 TaxID=3041257 RepID=UPI00280FED43|nr:cbb3-type cytochrome c oxidase N-terminal domain-containing protein [Pelagicoccus sp. SDUM812005]MDQ8179880.1 cbb3-type cytochrome c oxidase N-terminal domain-containing protein [Pelagicoccus sp. SDUM812005]